MRVEQHAGGTVELASSFEAFGLHQSSGQYTSLAALRLDKEEDEGFFRLSGELVELPTWLDDAAALLLKKPWLAHALDGYLEGVYARPEHPSLALICFTSAVESVATRIFYEEVCPECRSRRNLRRIYTEGLRVLLSREAAARLDDEYVARSKTAHTGKLHGMEAMPGVPMFLDWSGADEVSFYRRVWRAEAAAREVLLAALQDRLPARTHLPEPEPR